MGKIAMNEAFAYAYLQWEFTQMIRTKPNISKKAESVTKNWSDAWNTGSKEKVLDLYSDQATFKTSIAGGSISGKENLGSYISRLLRLYKDAKITPSAVHHNKNEDMIIIEWQAEVPYQFPNEGTPDQNKLMLKIEGVSTLTMKDDKILSESTYCDWLPIVAGTSLAQKKWLTIAQTKVAIDFYSIIKEIYKAWDEGDADKIVSYFADGIIFYDASYPSGIPGKVFVQTYLKEMFQNDPDMRFEVLSIEEMIGGLDFIVTWRAQLTEFTGPTKVEGADIVSFLPDGKIYKHKCYYDRLAILSGG